MPYRNPDIQVGGGLKTFSEEEKMVNQPLLSYINFSLQSGTVENVKKAVLGFFTPEQISEAKDVLWNNANHDIIGRKMARKTTKTRKEEEAHVGDILSALVKLDKEENMPYFVISALDLGKIPRSQPEELNSISIVDRLAKLEGKVTMQETVVMNSNDIHNLEIKRQELDECSNSQSRIPIVIHNLGATDSVWDGKIHVHDFGKDKENEGHDDRANSDHTFDA